MHLLEAGVEINVIRGPTSTLSPFAGSCGLRNALI
jgi:hypothetical protein